MNKLKITKRHWIMWVIISLLLYIIFNLQGLHFTLLEWIGIVLYNLSVFVFIVPLSKAIFPDTESEDYALIRRGFLIGYLFLTLILFFLLR